MTEPHLWRETSSCWPYPEHPPTRRSVIQDIRNNAPVLADGGVARSGKYDRNPDELRSRKSPAVLPRRGHFLDGHRHPWLYRKRILSLPICLSRKSRRAREAEPFAGRVVRFGAAYPLPSVQPVSPMIMSFIMGDRCGRRGYESAQTSA